MYGDDGDLEPELRSPPEFNEVQLSCRLCRVCSFLVSFFDGAWKGGLLWPGDAWIMFFGIMSTFFFITGDLARPPDFRSPESLPLWLSVSMEGWLCYLRKLIAPLLIL